MTHTFERLNASMEETTLENGLRICYFPKSGFSKRSYCCHYISYQTCLSLFRGRIALYQICL